MFQKTIQIQTTQGLQDITSCVQDALVESQATTGIVVVFCPHTSCSLLLNENTDADVQTDLETFFAELVPQHHSLYKHAYEGLDDMPAHIKVALTQSSLSIPFFENKLQLGVWQGLFLWEYREQPKERTIIVSILTGK